MTTISWIIIVCLAICVAAICVMRSISRRKAAERIAHERSEALRKQAAPTVTELLAATVAELERARFDVQHINDLAKFEAKLAATLASIRDRRHKAERHVDENLQWACR